MARQPYLGEGLLAPGVIRLFGRKFHGLTLGIEGINPTSNNPLVLEKRIDKADQRPREERMQNAEGIQDDHGIEPDKYPDPAGDRSPQLARIYGFSYLGSYYKMANPPVLRVFGDGFDVMAGFEDENLMDIIGVEFKNQDFVRGIRMWPVDQLDVVVRIDVTIGWLREILLDSDMSQDTNVTSNSGPNRADVVGRDSGFVGRDSGFVGRDSGFVGRSRR
jgi:hypothetical protein